MAAKFVPILRMVVNDYILLVCIVLLGMMLLVSNFCLFSIYLCVCTAAVARRSMPFRLSELVEMSVILRDVCLGVIELTHPDTRPVTESTRLTALQHLHLLAYAFRVRLLYMAISCSVVILFSGRLPESICVPFTVSVFPYISVYVCLHLSIFCLYSVCIKLFFSAYLPAILVLNLLIHVKFGMAEGHAGPLGRAKLSLSRCTGWVGAPKLKISTLW